MSDSVPNKPLVFSSEPRSSSGAHMLEAEAYASGAVFDQELEKIFSASWLFAGHVCQLEKPGDFFLTSLARGIDPDGGILRDEAIVIRGGDGTIRAFYNVCRHRASQICRESSGRVSGPLRCPYHSWTYELDGRLKHAPNMDDVEGFSYEQNGLVALGVGELDGLVFVHFGVGEDPEAAARDFDRCFQSFVGKARPWQVDQLVSVHQTSYRVRANWKLLFQNFSECYHCPGVHPQLNRLTPYREAWNDLEEGPFLGGPMRMKDPDGSMTMTGQRCAEPFSDLRPSDRGLVYYYTLSPNLFLSLHPDYVLVHRLQVLGPSTTEVHCAWYFHPEAVSSESFDPSPAIEFWDLTNRQDWELCEMSQRGVESNGYRPGPYSALESQLAAFDREYKRRMG